MKGPLPAALRRLDAGGLALDAVLAGMALLALVVSAVFQPETLPSLSLCPFHEVTGLPCPGCGLTRSVCAISHARFRDAWSLNPFGFVFYAVGLALLVWPVLRRRCPGLVKAVAVSPWVNRAPLALVLAMWAFGGWRIWAVLHGHGG